MRRAKRENEMSSIYVLRSYEERMPSEVYTLQGEAFDTFMEWPEEYRAYELKADGTWSDITDYWYRELAKADPVRECA
jgi:hypothetical protein